MRKLKLFIPLFLFALCMAFGGRPSDVAAAEREGQYYLGGMTAGFMLNAGGAEVIELNAVKTEEGMQCPAEKAGLRPGDCICAADGIKIGCVGDLNEALTRSGGGEVRLTVRRGAESIEVTLRPVKEKTSGTFKIGVLIRDTVSGMGTVTYIDRETLRFGALGHGLTDENNRTLDIGDPRMFRCSVIGVNKGTRGKAGELRGLFLNDKVIAQSEKVCIAGLYGTFEQNYDFSACKTIDILPISEATIGKAVIYSTVDGTSPQEYEIAIAKVDADNRENKNFVIKVTDERLIEETGGIVQGMSGSPIVQNGKLIGAVTHVFVNDPVRGYGIGIEKMICE